MDIEHVRSRFIKHFDGTTGFVYASPGRINLIGQAWGLSGQRGRGDRLGLPRRGLHLSAQLFGRPLHRTATGPGGAALGDAGGAAGGAGGGTAFRHRSRRRRIWFHREVGEKKTSKQRGEMPL